MATSAHPFGFWAAVGTGSTTLLSFAIAIATPPLSGPACRAGCIGYPYLDIAARFPRDYAWMFPAMLSSLFTVALVVALHGRARADAWPWSTLAVVLAAMSAVVLVGDYFVQLAVVQPSILAGETDGISLLTQYNPHGLFIALEELGHLLLSLALACAASALSAATRLERVVRWMFRGGLVVNALALAWIVARLGHARGYTFEVVIIAIDWLVIVVGAFSLAAVFRRQRAPAGVAGRA